MQTLHIPSLVDIDKGLPFHEKCMPIALRMFHVKGKSMGEMNAQGKLPKRNKKMRLLNHMHASCKNKGFKQRSKGGGEEYLHLSTS